MNRAWKFLLMGLVAWGAGAVDLRAEDDEAVAKPAPVIAVKVDAVADAFSLPKGFTPTKDQAERLKDLHDEFETQVRDTVRKVESSKGNDKASAERELKSLRIRIKSQISRIVSTDLAVEPDKKASETKPRREGAKPAEKVATKDAHPASVKPARDPKGTAAKPTREPKTPVVKGNGKKTPPKKKPKDDSDPFADSSTKPSKAKAGR